MKLGTVETRGTHPIERDQSVVSEEFYGVNIRTKCDTSVGNDRTAWDSAVGAKGIITDRDIPESVHPDGDVVSDVEWSTKRPKEALGLDVTGKTSSRVLYGEGKAPTHCGGAADAEVDDLLRCSPSANFDAATSPSVHVVATFNAGAAGFDKALSPYGNVDGDDDGVTGRGWQTKHPKMALDSDVKSRVPIQGGENLIEEVGDTQVQHGSPGHEPVTEPLGGEGDTGTAAAMGMEPQVLPAETPEYERQRRRPRGGRQSSLTGVQKRAFRNARDAKPE
jgi:hypothetical protein